MDFREIEAYRSPAPPSPRTKSRSPGTSRLSPIVNFGGPLLAPIPQKFNMCSFIDPLDEQIAYFNPEQEGTPSPPPGILNAPYEMNGLDIKADRLDPNYDSDWHERLFDPVPGAGVYLGEMKDPTRTPRDRNVVYISLDTMGNPVVLSLPFNRRGLPINFHRRSEVEKKEICFRKGLGKKWTEGGKSKKGMDHMKELAKRRILLKNELDMRRSLRFQEDLVKFWKEKEKSLFVGD